MNKSAGGKPTNIKVISWDVDGTLYDTKAMKACLVKLWLKALWRPSTWRDISAILASQKMIKKIHRNHGEYGNLFSVEKRLLAEQAEKRWFYIVLKSVGLRTGIPEALDDFQQRGMRQIIVSDYRPDYKLEALGLVDVFENKFACENYHNLKPSPVVFDVVCEELGVLPAEILHIGDRLDTDGVAAKNAGCQFFHLADSTIFDAKKVLNIFKIAG